MDFAADDTFDVSQAQKWKQNPPPQAMPDLMICYKK